MLNRCAWPGQFIGLTPNWRSSVSVMNMFSRYLPQCPEVFHSSLSYSCGVLTSV